MTIYDEFLKFQHRVDQRANALALQMIKELEASRETIIGKLAALQDKYLRKEFSEESYARKKALLIHQRAEVQKVLVSVYDKVRDHIKEAADDVFKATQTHTVDVMNEAFGLSISFYHLDESAVQAWFETSTVEGLVLNEWLEKLEAGAADRIIKVQRQAMIEGLSVGQTVKMLREKGFEGSYTGLSGLARTSLMSAANQARYQTLTENFSDNIDGWMHVSTLDSRTCLPCAASDGIVYGVYEKLPPLPMHWNCRCCYIPLIKAPKNSIIEQVFKKLDKTGERASEFGPVPSRMNYNSWLRSMLDEDPQFVRSVLGKGRYELFREGKITLDSMVTDGRVKRLSEL